MSHKPYKDILGRDFDFKVKYRIYKPDEGGRFFPASQGIRWDFMYDTQKNEGRQLFLIWPKFEDQQGNVIISKSEPVPYEGTAQMWIINKDSIDYHIKRIEIGSKGFFHEGGKQMGECEVISTNFFKTVVLKHFRKKHHNRVVFVKKLMEFNSDLGLKDAKEFLDQMVEGQPVHFQCKSYHLKTFMNELDELQMEYEIETVANPGK